MPLHTIQIFAVMGGLAGFLSAAAPAPVAKLPGVLRSFSPNGRYAGVADRRTVTLYDTVGWKACASITLEPQDPDPTRKYSAVVVDNAGRLMVADSADPEGVRFKVWEALARPQLVAASHPDARYPMHPTFDRQGNLALGLLLRTETEGRCRVWDGEYDARGKKSYDAIVTYGGSVSSYRLDLRAWMQEVVPYLGSRNGKIPTEPELAAFLSRRSLGDPQKLGEYYSHNMRHGVARVWLWDVGAELVVVLPQNTRNDYERSRMDVDDLRRSFQPLPGMNTVELVPDGVNYQVAKLVAPEFELLPGTPWTARLKSADGRTLPLTHLGLAGHEPRRVSPDGRWVAFSDGATTLIHAGAVVADAYAGLDPEVLYDVLMDKIVGLLKGGKPELALPYFTRLEYGAASLPESFYFYQMETLERVGQSAEARLKAEAYLRRFGKKGKYYAKVVALMARL